jgi:hypothetical protein
MRVSSGSTTRVRAARIREKRSTRGWKTTRGRERRRSALPPNAPYAPRNRGVVHQARQDAFFERREALALQQVRHPGVRRRVVLLRGGTGEAVRFRFAEVAFRGDACGGNLQGAARNRSGTYVQGIQRLVERVGEHLHALLGLEFDLHRAPRCVEPPRPRVQKQISHATVDEPLAKKKGGKALLFDRRIAEFIGTSTDSPVTDPETPIQPGFHEKSLAIFVEWCRDV